MPSTPKTATIPLDYYHRPGIEYLVDFLLTPQMLSLGDPAMLWALWNDMKYKDWFMALLDVESYIAEKERALAAYEDPHRLGPENAGEHRQIRLLLLRPHHRPVRRRHLASAPGRPL